MLLVFFKNVGRQQNSNIFLKVEDKHQGQIINEELKLKQIRLTEAYFNVYHPNNAKPPYCAFAKSAAQLFLSLIRWNFSNKNTDRLKPSHFRNQA